MDITPLTPKEKLVISHYGDGGFVISGTRYEGNILIMADRVVAWPATGIKDTAPEVFGPLFAGELPEILLVGTGPLFEPLPQNLREMFREKNIMLDGMDTGAACRTYSVLLAEGRSVAAALIAV
jgi:uncharacterized protein